MLYFDDIKVEFESQEFKGTHIEISPNKDKSVLFLESVRSTHSVQCPYCGGSVIYENGQVKLKDIPIWRGTAHIWNFFIHRYQCNCCHETFTGEIPFKYPGTRITYRATNWIKGFNNKIKVAKRIGYGYRDDDFFFTLIRYLSISSVRSPSHKKS